MLKIQNSKPILRKSNNVQFIECKRQRERTNGILLAN